MAIFSGRRIVASQNDHYDVLDDAEEIDVGVVDGEVDEDSTSGTVQPEIVEQRLEQRERFVHGMCKILHETAAVVRPDQTPVR